MTSVQSEAAMFSLAANELASAVVNLSNLPSIVSQLLTSKGLTPQTVYDWMSTLEFPILDFLFIYLELRLLQE